MPGVTVSFVADPKLAARVKHIAQADGVTPSQAAARASALGTMIPPAARRAFRFVMEQGDEQTQAQLAMLLTKAVAQAGNLAVERQLLARAPENARDTEEELAALATRAVAAYRHENRGMAE